MGIVLHWYGDDLGFDQTVEGYLRGFNVAAQADNYLTRTSAHFLIGRVSPIPGLAGDQAKEQTPKPSWRMETGSPSPLRI